MAQMTEHPIMKMEISYNCVCAQHLVGGGEVWVCLSWGHPEVSWSQESSTVVSATTGSLLSQSMKQLVLPVLYLMLRWNCCKYVDHF